MDSQETRILIYSSDTETIDAIFDLCELSQVDGLRLATCATLDAVEDYLEHHSTSLLFFDFHSFPEIEQLSELAQRVSPKPTIAFISQLEQNTLVRALRNGADGVFSLDEVRNDPLSLVRSLDRQLDRANAIESARYLRDSLSQSLEELKADQDAAAQIQQRLLPPTHQSLDDQLSCEYLLRPSLLLSGDFIDLIPLKNDQYLFYLADVSGHGASSALVTVLLKNMTNRLQRAYFKGESDRLENPQQLLEHFNREILLTSFGKHMTMLIGVVDTKASKLTYSIGGHHPSMVLVQGDKAHYLEGRGMPVGLFEEPLYEEHSCELADDFSIYLFSDGILEIIKGDKLEEKEQNLLRLCQADKPSPEALLKRVVDEEAELPDDVAIMMVSRRC